MGGSNDDSELDFDDTGSISEDDGSALDDVSVASTAASGSAAAKALKILAKSKLAKSMLQ